MKKFPSTSVTVELSPVPGQAPVAAFWRRLPPWARVAIIVLATLAAYLPALSAGYIWDDDVFLTQNPLIKAPDGLYRFWFTKEPIDYFPLTSTDLWLEWRLWGDNPLPYHLGNILLHAAAAVLLWRVLVRLKAPGAFLAGMIFALHPVAVSSVAWITERKNTLPMVLMLGSVLMYLRFDEGGRKKLYALALALFLAALLAKPSVVMLPAALLLCAFWLRGRIDWKDVLRSLPFLAMSIGLGLATVWFQYNRSMGGQPVDMGSLSTRIALSGWIAWFYLSKLLAPVGLCMVYPRWQVDGGQWLSFVPVFSMLALVAALFFLRRRIGRGPVTALAYFLVTLAPVLGFVSMSFMQYSFVADHLQYAAMIGIIALVAGLLAKVPLWGRVRAAWPIAAGVVLLGVLGTLSFMHASDFKDTRTLWLANLRVHEGSWAVWSDLSVNQSDPAQQLACCDRALRLKPDYAPAWSNRAQAQWALGKYQQSLEDANRAIELEPKLAAAYVNRAAAWHSLGRDDLAEQDSMTAMKLQPGLVAAYLASGDALLGQGSIDEALDDYSQAIRSRPSFAEAYNGRALAFRAKQMVEPALRDFTRAIELRPDYAEAYSNRGNLLQSVGQLDVALADHMRAIQINPHLAGAYNNRAICYYALKQYDLAWGDVRTFRSLGGTPPPKFIEMLSQASGRSE